MRRHRLLHVNFVLTMRATSPARRLGVETLQRILADADADRQERAETAVHAGQEFDPLLRRLGAGGAGADQQQR